MLRSTKLGVVVRGVVDSPEMSAGLGVNPNVVSAGTWVLGTMMVALVGILLVPALGLDPTGYQTPLPRPSRRRSSADSRR